MTQLKLQALDEESLIVLSALCQDAVVRRSDFSYNPEAKTFALVCNRFDWVAAGSRPSVRSFERVRAGVRFTRVTRARFSWFDRAAGGEVLSLLALKFEMGEAPGGVVRLQFAAGAEIRLDVECIEVELKDLGAEWSTGAKPDHTVPETG